MPFKGVLGGFNTVHSRERRKRKAQKILEKSQLFVSSTNQHTCNLSPMPYVKKQNKTKMLPDAICWILCVWFIDLRSLSPKKKVSVKCILSYSQQGATPVVAAICQIA